MTQENNGNLKSHYDKRFDRVDEKIHELKDDLVVAIRDHADSINRLADRLDNIIEMSKNTIPIKVVFWMFLILALGLVGEKGAEVLLKLYLPGAL